MKVEITDPVEIHLIFVEKYQKSSVNIVVRAEIDACYAPEVYEQAIVKLINQHPYINSRYFSEKVSEEFHYYYEELNQCAYDVQTYDVTNEEISNIKNSLSDMRVYLFNHSEGELFRVNVYRGRNTSLIELTISHIVGEIPSAIILMGDYLKYIDKIGESKSIEVVNYKKYFFHEEDFSWSNFELQDLGFSDNEAVTLPVSPWEMPEAVLSRHKLSTEIFSAIKKWLSKSQIDAKVSDVFYYIADQVLLSLLGKRPDLWLILSYRNKLKENNVNQCIYNFAFFSPVDTSSFSDDVKQWLESFYDFRVNMITPEGVCMSRSVFHSLNIAMQGASLESGKAIMDSVVKFPDFAFNNLGRIDQYIGDLESFNIIDFDVQDGTPAQEIRYFSLNDELYINPTFFKNSGVKNNEFWKLFIENLNILISE